MKNNFKSILLYLAFIAVIIATVTLVLGGTKEEPPVFSDIYNYFAEEQVRSFTVTEKLELILKIRSEEAPEDETKDETLSFRLLDYELFREAVIEGLVLGENGQQER